MRILIFDTETTGLPKYRKSAKEQAENWPHIVSISWVLLENNTIVSKHSYIVKPNKWNISAESIAIHGITNENAIENGHDLEFVMNEFISEKYDLMLAHNLDFDENVIVNAIYWDLGRKNFLEFPLQKKCTMNVAKNMCRLPFKSGLGYKSPKLSELYFHVFKAPPVSENLHNSMYDAEILVKILQGSEELRERLGIQKL